MTARASLFALLAVGCGGEPPPALGDGLPSDLAADLNFCPTGDVATRDWCANEVLEIRDGMAGTETYEVCVKLQTAAARDRCVEMAVRRGGPWPTDTVCDEITATPLRESCWLAVADRTMFSEVDIGRINALCRRAGSLVPHCLGHIPGRRVSQWRTGEADVATEVSAVLASFPEAAEAETFGGALGLASAKLGRAATLCALLPTGVAQGACERSAEGRQ